MNDLFASVKAIATPEVFRAFYPDVELRRDGSGREKALCPFHDENTPSLTIYENHFKCFGCGNSGSNIDLLLKGNHASTPLEAAKMIAERFGIPVEKRNLSKQKPLTLAEYVSYVKVPQDFLCKNFHIKETPEGISFPYQDENGNQIGVQLRHFLEKGKGKRFTWNGKPYLYGAWYIPKWKEKGFKRVVVCEGASDTQVCWFKGIPTLGVPGATAFKSEWSSVLLSFSEIVIIQELDKAGEGFAKDIVSKLKAADYQGKVKAVCLPEKDIRDLWLKRGEKFKDELEDAISTAPLIDLESIQTRTKKYKQSIPSELEDRFIHPALHIESGFSSIGVINRNKTKESFSIFTSDGREYAAEGIKDILTTPPITHPGLSGRWKRSAQSTTLSEAIALLIEKARSLIWFEDESWYSFISLWCAGTYLFPAFAAFPYIQLTGEKGSGKTKTEALLECVCFNALRMIDPTPAVLFRIVHALRPTLLMDEVEKMNTDEAREVRGIVNAGYKQGATVLRVEGEDRKVKFFEVYSPKCLAGIRGLGSVTEDRCITIVMSKPIQDDPIQNRTVDSLDAEWSVIRDGFYRLPFSYGDKILQGLDEKSFPVWLRARDRELWSPILQMAQLVDGESDLGLFKDVLGLAHVSVGERGLTFEAEAVLGLLEEMLDGTGVLKLHPVDLAEELEASLNLKKISPEWIASRLRSFGFKKTGRDRKGVIYEVTAEKLSDIRCRYTPPEQPTHLQSQEPTQPEATESKGEY